MQIGRMHASCNNQEAKPVKDLDFKKKIGEAFKWDVEIFLRKSSSFI